MWYAPNRLGFNQLCFFVFGHGQPQRGRRVLLVTRVMEKPAPLAVAALMDFLPMLLKHGCKMFSVISDGASHFKNYGMVSWLAYACPLEHRGSTKITWGESSHMKGIPDAAFASSERARNTIKCKKALCGIPEMCEEMQLFFDKEWEVTANEPVETQVAHTLVIDWMPRSKVEVLLSLRRVQTSTLPCQITDTHSYEFKIMDDRFDTLLGKYDKLKITRISAKAPVLAFENAKKKETAPLTSTLWLQPADAAPLPALDHPVAEQQLAKGEAAFLMQHTREYRGWRVSYRRTDGAELDMTSF